MGNWTDLYSDEHDLLDASDVDVGAHTVRVCIVYLMLNCASLFLFPFPSPSPVPDHMVPLQNANEAGGWAWTNDERRDYANDMADPDHLLPVSLGDNRAKGSRGPEEWKPPYEPYWCEYANDWLRIKARWHLTMDEAEWAAIESMVVGCPPELSPLCTGSENETQSCPSPSCLSTASAASQDPGIIAGAVVGALACVALAAVVSFVRCRASNRRRRSVTHA
eukprot:m.158619 g.158619  ORF g.158619 m.158619 type:complete len:221 (-) comp10250_c0_seq3:104-766(-)